ncbi:hypothetical protein BRAS3843_860049 [Bradyrhizobium sp. STM 3843]|uniref:pentapeptide repeat-containing protein n=1 Tax=Bradyrhizobium sp. STM 3843 TaxID=551947 RepID=UPI0002403147|nr:pentapeptide repeat-containing protein [Bradyrhizobium sp. STM 3843]CCE11925.1 hypothetical protein BRAS3843_860049 [Bradyrhizobium sp. STM 3843]
MAAANDIVVPRPSTEESALDACVAFSAKGRSDVARADLGPRLRDPKKRIEAEDRSGQNLAGRNFSGKIFVSAKLKAASLRGADLTGAIICSSDLTGVDLTGAHLERAFIGGGTELDGANLGGASAHGLTIADASGAIRIDGADLGDATIMCEPGDFVPCLGNRISIVSMFGTNLRGATIDHLCCSALGLQTARLGGVTTQLNGYHDMNFTLLAAGVAESERITLIPDYGFSGHKTEFTGEEVHQLAPIVNRMQLASVHPSFDCSRSRTDVEKAICADSKLAALDRALAWLWEKVEHNAAQNADQGKWFSTRGDCPPPGEDSRGSFVSAADPRGCIGLAYVERIKQLAPVSTATAIGSATYTTDRPMDMPRDKTAALAQRFIAARGFRVDEITVKTLGNGAGHISGYGVWANGHLCGFDASEPETKRAGSQFRITDGSATPRDDDSISFAITPWVVVRVGGDKQFQCGARGGWSDVYFRQPDSLVSTADGLTPPQ